MTIKIPAIDLLSVTQRADILRSYATLATHIRVTPHIGKQSIEVEALKGGLPVARQEILNAYIPHTIAPQAITYDLTTFAYGVTLITVNRQPALYFGIVDGPKPTADDRQYIYYVPLSCGDDEDACGVRCVADDITSCIQLFAPIADLSEVYTAEEEDAV